VSNFDFDKGLIRALLRLQFVELRILVVQNRVVNGGDGYSVVNAALVNDRR